MEDDDCLRRSDQDSRGQAVQRVQGEEDVRLALEGARPVPQQLAALQVWRDVLHADGLQEVEIRDESISSSRTNEILVVLLHMPLLLEENGLLIVTSLSCSSLSKPRKAKVETFYSPSSF